MIYLNKYLNSYCFWLILSILLIIIIFYYNSNTNHTNSNKLIETENKKITVYYFYADWCPHCQNFSSEWKKYIDLVKNNNLDININMINNCENSALCQKFNIQGFPTIIFETCNQDLVYKGDLNSQDIYKYTMQIYKTI
jgi:thiol-disulfide isomerase/thioredoxin